MGLLCSGSGGIGRNHKNNEIQQVIGLHVHGECCKEGEVFCSSEERELSWDLLPWVLRVSWESSLRTHSGFPQQSERQALLSCFPPSGVRWKLKAFSSLPPLLQDNQLWHLTLPQPLKVVQPPEVALVFFLDGLFLTPPHLPHVFGCTQSWGIWKLPATDQKSPHPNHVQAGVGIQHLTPREETLKNEQKLLCFTGKPTSSTTQRLFRPALKSN